MWYLKLRKQFKSYFVLLKNITKCVLYLKREIENLFNFIWQESKSNNKGLTFKKIS